MKKNYLIGTGLLISCLLLASSCAIFHKSTGKDTVDLTFKMPANQSIVISVQSENEIQSEQMGQTINVSTEGSNKMKLTALDQSDEGTTVEFENLEMTQKVESPMGGGESDFSAIIGLKTRGLLSPKGSLTDLQGFDEYPTITNALGEPITGEIYKQGVEQIFFAVPEEPIKVGSTWSENVDSEVGYGGGKLKTTGTVEYVVLERTEVDGMDCFKIQATGNTKTTGEFQQQGMDITMDRTGKSSSTFLFAIDKGFYISTESSSISEGIVDVPAAGMSIPQSIKAKSSITVEFK